MRQWMNEKQRNLPQVPSARRGQSLRRSPRAFFLRSSTNSSAIDPESSLDMPCRASVESVGRISSPAHLISNSSMHSLPFTSLEKPTKEKP